jgi:hypothetical protein
MGQGKVCKEGLSVGVVRFPYKETGHYSIDMVERNRPNDPFCFSSIGVEFTYGREFNRGTD